VAQNRGGPFVVLAVLLGLAAAFVVFLYLNQQSAASVTTRTTSPVVVAASDLTFGTKLERPMLKVVNYPKDSVPVGAYTTLDSVEGPTTKIFLATREPVLATKLSSVGGGLSMLVRPQYRASSVTVNYVSSVSGFVVPGDRVDVLVTIDKQESQTQNATTTTILQNIEVLAAGVKTTQKDKEDKPNTDLQAVTLLVAPEEAEKMALAMHEGKIHLTLRNPEDADTLKLASVRTSQILGLPPPSATPRPSAPRTQVVYRDRPVPMPVPEEPHKVRVIKAGKGSDEQPANR
jgi:pilus assembly protein CpaB